MSRVKVLLADNLPETLAVHCEYLESLGYIVYAADSPETAKELLEQEVFAVAIIDLRLTDDSDDQDQSGFLVAERIAELRLVTQSIMCTNWPSWKVVRQALSPSSRIACDFLGKEEGLERLSEAVSRAVERLVYNGVDLETMLPGPRLVEKEIIAMLFEDQWAIAFLQLEGGTPVTELVTVLQQIAACFVGRLREREFVAVFRGEKEAQQCEVTIRGTNFPVRVSIMSKENTGTFDDAATLLAAARRGLK